MIDNGNAVNIWEHRWILDSPNIKPLPPSPDLFQSNLQRMYQRFIPGTKERNNDLLVEYPPNFQINVILIIKPRERQQIDQFIWSPNASGVFTTKSTYVLDQKVRFRSLFYNSFEWRKTRRVRIHDQDKSILWKLITSSLPTLDILSQRMLMQDLSCLFYHNSLESADHVFFHWPLMS